MKIKLLLVLLLAHFSIYAQQYTLIPDVNFEQKLIELGYDDLIDGKVNTANIADVKKLQMQSSSITDLTGIQDFKNLEDLDIANNKITNLNVSNNKSLTWLQCQRNELTSLDISQNTKLVIFNCGDNKIASLDVTHNPELTYIYCHKNLLTTLDLTNNILLDDLYIAENKITNIDLTHNPLLVSLFLEKNNITNLNISNNLELIALNASDNQISKLDLSKHKKLMELFLTNCSLKELNLQNGKNTLIDTDFFNLKNNPNLTCIQVDNTSYANTNWSASKDASAIFKLDCNDSVSYTLIPDVNFEKKLIELGIDSGTPDGNILSSSIESVTELNLYYSNISDLTGIEGFKALTSLNVMSNKLSTVDLSKNLALNYLLISYNNLTTLDISNNIALDNLSVSNNKIQNIDVSNNLKLKYFSCSSNQLTTIDVSNNKELVLLNCQLNQLKSLDLSQNKKLSLLTCSENKTLTNIDLRNGNNRNMQIAPYVIDFTKNPLLTCILVDNPIYSNEKWASFKEKSASYSTVDCSQITAIPDPAFEDKLIYLQIDKDGKNGTVLNTSISNITVLNVENSNIKNLTGINGFSNLSTLNCSSNLLTALDLSQNKALTFINCGSNNLTSLNLKNGNNKNLDLNSSFTKNPDLTCITVDDEVYANQKWASIKDDAANYNLDCTVYTAIDSNFEKKLIELGIDNDGVNGKVSVENLEKITSLNLSNSNINDLKGIEKFTGLTYLDCSGNNINTIDVSKNLNLTKLDLNSNHLTSLDVTKNTKLLNLSFAYNEVSTINLANNKELLFLNTSKNLLTNLDLTSNTALSLIDCSRNNLTQLNVSNAPELTNLIIDRNKITALDLSLNTKLVDLYCSNNELTSLDLSYNILLKRLSASWNQLTTLDLSHNPLLERVYVEFNPLNSLNIQNGNNKNFVLPSVSGKMADDTIIYTSFLGNAKLNCIQVDDENYSNANWSNIKESTTTYSNTCKSLGIDKSEFSQVILYPNPTKGEITINNIALDKATVYNALGQFVKSFTLNNVNTYNTIDLSGLPRGVYYVYLINGDAASAKKVIVE